MKQPSTVMRTALRQRLTKIRKCWPGEDFWPSYSVVFLNTSPPDATQRIRIRAEDVTIGQYSDFSRYDPDGLADGVSSLPRDHTPSPFPKWVHDAVDRART